MTQQPDLRTTTEAEADWQAERSRNPLLDTSPTQADGLRALAALVEANPELFESIDFGIDRMLIPVNHIEDPRGVMAQFIRAGNAAGAAVRKGYDEYWGSVDVDLGGGVVLHVYADRELVCERIVTGTREVFREVPDAAALAAVPKTTVTETVEDVEWRCLPLLAEPAKAAS